MELSVLGTNGGTSSAHKSYVSTCYNLGNIQGYGSELGGIAAYVETYCTLINSYVYSGATVKYSSSSASYDLGSNSSYYGRMVGHNEGTVTIGGNSCSTGTNRANLSSMPTVFSVVSGSNGSLNNGTESNIWKYDENNLNAPKLKWEK